MIKKIGFIFFVFLFSYVRNHSQCNVTISSTAPLVLCSPGNINITANGTGAVTAVLDNDFDAGNAGVGWNVSPAGQFNNPCDPSIDGGTYMWMGNTTAAPRTLETVPLDVSCGGQICFYFDMATQGDLSPCEGPDEIDEGVYFEYSINGGFTWTNIYYFTPNENGSFNAACPGCGDFTAWHQYCYIIPGPAETTNTIFRWYQGGSTNTGYDHWGIDNVEINANNCGSIWYDWNHISGTSGPSGDPSSINVNINSDTTFYVNYTDGTGNFQCSDSISFIYNGFQVTSTSNNNSCNSINGSCDGGASVIISANQNPVNFQWSSNGIPINGATSSSISSMCPGNYTCDISNANCSAVENFTITEPAAMVSTITKTDENCSLSNGIITVNVTNGNTPISYAINGNPSTNNNVFTNLSSGNHTIVVTDNNGCTTTELVTIYNLAGPSIDSVVFQSPTCFDSLNGFIEIYASGSVGLQYSIDGGVNLQNSNVFSGLGGNSYDIFVTDGVCSETHPTFSLTTPADIQIGYTTQISCPPCACNTVVDLSTSSGGTGALNYSIDNGVSFQSNATFFNVCAGNYDITITDQQGCNKSQFFTIQALPNINVSVVSNDPNCFGFFDGDITLNITGGTGSAQVSLNGGPLSSSTQYSNLSSGNYNFTISDSCGCFIDTMVTLNDPVQVQIDSVLINDEICFGDCMGQIEINSPTAVTYLLVGNQIFNSLSPNFDSLCSGTYMVFAENANGCLDSAVVDVSSPPKLTFSNFSVDTTICIGGTVTSSANIVGGTGNIDYFWSNGSTGSLINWSTLNDTSIYAFGVDDVGCHSDTMSQNVFLFPPLTLTMSSDTFMCNSDTTLIFANVSGGIGTGYQYIWNSGLPDTSHHFVYPIYSKNYTVNVNDGCETPSVSGSVYITVYPLPPADFNVDVVEGCIPLDVEFVELFSDTTGICSWDFGDLNFSNLCGTVSHTYTNEGCWNVSLTYTDTLNCSRTQQYDSLVCSYAYPITDFYYSPQDVSLIDNYVTFFNNSSPNATQFLWTLGDSTQGETFNTENFSYSFQDMELGIYPICLSASNDFGCETTFCSTIELKDDFLFYMPNSFTADGDGVNDLFGPVVHGADQFGYKMEIFNRWGELVFQSTNLNINWDGANIDSGNYCEPGVYVWRVEVNDLINFKRKEFFGNVTLVR